MLAVPQMSKQLDGHQATAPAPKKHPRREDAGGAGPTPRASDGLGVSKPHLCEEHPWHLLSCCLRPYWVLKGMIAGPIPYLWGRLTPKMSGATPEQPKSYSGEPPSVPAHSRGSHTLGFFPSLLLSFTLGRLPRVCAVQ